MFKFTTNVVYFLSFYSNINMNQITLYNTANFIFNRVFPVSIQLFAGSQDNHNGTASIEKVESIRKRLLSQSACGISFNPNKVSGTITEGTCSAMALEFASAYAKRKEDLSKKIIEIVGSLQSISKLLLLFEIKKLGENFQTSSEEMRVRQAAYDTIEVIPTLQNIDLHRGKIQSIANYHNFKITFATEIINAEMLSCPEDIRQYVSLPNGIYLLRTLKPAPNEKLEQYGHSTIYIQEDNCKIFYDPNRGAYDLTEEDIVTKFFTIFQTQWLMYQNNTIRLYRLSA